MLWDFEKLTLDGTPPTLTPPTPTFVPFSGSDALIGNSIFYANFPQGWGQSFSFLNYTGGSVPNMGRTYDGSIKLNVGLLEQDVSGDNQGGPWYLNLIKSQVSFNIYSTNTSDSFSVRVVAQPWDDSTETLGTADYISSTINSTNGSISVSNLPLAPH